MDAYAITDANGWHYHYPPLFAILLRPLADPPPDSGDTGLPFPVTVVAWYVISVGFAFLGTWALVTATRQRWGPVIGDGVPAEVVRGSPRIGWALAAWPLAFSFPGLVDNFVRGQVGTIVIAGIAGFAALLLLRRPLLAGASLGGIILLKLIPAALLAWPVWRRDWRTIAGVVVTLVVGGVGVPWIVMGWPATAAAYRSIYHELVVPSVEASGADTSRAREITDVNSTDNQSLLAVLHNIEHPTVPRSERPRAASKRTRVLHLVGAVVLFTVPLAAAGWRRSNTPGSLGDDTVVTLLAIGALTISTLLASPLSHTHYFCALLVPIFAIIVARLHCRPFPHLGTGWLILLGSTGVVIIVSAIPFLWWIRDMGLVMWQAAILWVACIGLMIQRRRALRALAAERVSAAQEGGAPSAPIPAVATQRG